VGCANGHLLESMVAWCAERGIRLEPYGVDLSAGLVAEARRRLPQWADRIWVGNALDWTAPDGRRFDFVHTLLDLVPAARLERMLRHQLEHLVAAGGRLLVSRYVPAGDRSRHADQVLRRLGFRVDGVTGPAEPGGQRSCRRPGSSTADHAPRFLRASPQHRSSVGWGHALARGATALADQEGCGPGPRVTPVCGGASLLLEHGGELAKVAEAHRLAWSTVMAAVPDGARLGFDQGRFLSIQFRRAPAVLLPPRSPAGGGTAS
jgi:hypothetical protein